MRTTPQDTNIKSADITRRAGVRGAAAGTLLATVALVASGCGGGSPHAVALDDPAFMARTKAICVRSQAAVDKLTKPVLPTETAAYIGKSLPILNQAMAEMQTIEPPASERPTYARFVGWFGQMIGRVDQMKEASEASNQPRVEQLVQEAQAQGETGRRLVAELHLPGCEVFNEDAGEAGQGSESPTSTGALGDTSTGATPTETTPAETTTTPGSEDEEVPTARVGAEAEANPTATVAGETPAGGAKEAPTAEAEAQSEQVEAPTG